MGWLQVQHEEQHFNKMAITELQTLHIQVLTCLDYDSHSQFPSSRLWIHAIFNFCC